MEDLLTAVQLRTLHMYMWQELGREKYTLTFILTLSWILRFLRRPNKRGEIFKTAGLSKHVYKKLVSYSHLLVFYSEQVQRSLQGYFTNWNTSGYLELSHSLGK
jgi:hypothetical protein